MLFACTTRRLNRAPNHIITGFVQIIFLVTNGFENSVQIYRIDNVVIFIGQVKTVVKIYSKLAPKSSLICIHTDLGLAYR